MEPKLSKYLASFRERHNIQHASLKIIETWRAVLSKGNKVGVIIMDLSKAFDTLNHKLLLCKLKAYGFNKNALAFIQSYFTNRHQRTKVGDKFSKMAENFSRCAPRLHSWSFIFQHFHQ